MKPRTAVATFILDAIKEGSMLDLYEHARDHKQNGNSLTSKEQERIDEVYADFERKITALLRAEGAEVGDESMDSFRVLSDVAVASDYQLTAQNHAADASQQAENTDPQETFVSDDALDAITRKMCMWDITSITITR